MIEEPMPPLGVRLTVDVQAREGAEERPTTRGFGGPIQ
jgi:hypothetical protein